ncbi:Protein Translation Initiation Factor 2 subunit gamma (IF-2g) [Giardia duodenalis]|uniref:protein-synthesizing GTPase n=2 Tax=Giardia intestinalis TaxID=5741 RepID=C6LPH3_GIAIB|nr:Translation initiation factor 2 gamma subunit [Giardia intestinalis ATCC 50581]ESU41338.1 Protein Translation Initiation Factor 2 subunit gamma (IF-2g) [Giardia intestinalis]
MADSLGTLPLTPMYLSQQPFLKPEELHPTHPDVISRQATINIGTIGHVAHGKSTLVKAITGITTGRFHSEMERNITIKLGYANAKIFRCPKCPEPHNYFPTSSSMPDNSKCKMCGSVGTLVRHVSFVDCPGHDFYMATMLTGACVMDAALLLIAADQPCPQSQTKEHLAAIDIAGITKADRVIIVQNKIDLIKEQEAKSHHQQIVNYLNISLKTKNPYIIPTSAVSGYNVDLVLHHIVNKLPIPTRDLTLPPLFMVIRSFDVNKPGYDIDNIRGGVAGGTLLQGMFKLGDTVEIRPGYTVMNEKTGKCSCYPLITKIISIKADENELRYAIPGGLIAIGTFIDPSYTRQDRLVGSVIGYPGHMPPIRLNITIYYELMHQLISAVNTNNTKIAVLAVNEVILFTIGSNSVSGTIKAVRTVNGAEKIADVVMSKPICAKTGEQIAISRKIATGASRSWRLIGWGKIQDNADWENLNSTEA